jgi:hypothetical protein
MILMAIRFLFPYRLYGQSIFLDDQYFVIPDIKKINSYSKGKEIVLLKINMEKIS